MKTANIIYLVLSTAQSIPSIPQYKQQIADQSPSSSGETVDTSNSILFAQCTCDLTNGACDLNCCCDPDCDKGLVNQWLQKPLENCLQGSVPYARQGFNQCWQELFQSQIQDVQLGIKYFYKLIEALFCAIPGQSQISNDFIAKRDQINDEDVIKEFDVLDYQSNDGEIQQTALYKYQQQPGYQPFETIKGFLKIDDKIQDHKVDNKINIQSAGLFGQCSDATTLLFLQTIEQKTCSIQSALGMTKDFCENSLSLQQLLQWQIYKSSDPGDSVPINLRNVIKYDYMADSQFQRNVKTTQEDLLKVINPVFTAGAQNQCDNFILEYHLIFYYKQENSQFLIESAEIDLIYGNVLSKPTDSIRITRTSSISYRQNDDNRKTSGNPGYQWGLPLKVGNLTDDPTSDLITRNNQKKYIKELIDGLYLIGANNKGECTTLKDSISHQQTMTKFDIENLNDDQLQYFEEQKLTFEDQITYGCHVDLTLDDLKNYCADPQTNKLPLFNYVLFQNFFANQYIGQFANSIPEHPKEWIPIEIKDYQTTWSIQDVTCRLPSIAKLAIFYTKVGKKEQSSMIIEKAYFEWLKNDESSQWTFTQPDAKMKQRFQAKVYIEFIEDVKEQVLFVPKTPIVIQPLNKNALYPFVDVQTGN